MLFADLSLASRIERAEAHLVADASANVARRLGHDAVFVQAIAGGVAAFTEAQSPLNKVAGLGFDGPVDERELELVEQAGAARHCPVQIEVATLADPSVVRLLTSRGYELVGFENVLGRPIAAVGLPQVPDSIDVTTTGFRFDTWLDVVVAGFASPDLQGVPSAESYPREVLDRVVRDFASSEGVALYLARKGGDPAGGGSMRIGEGIAQLCGAATLPEHRRQGVQSALLAARLRDAGAAGCEVAVVTTQPGSKSQQNAQKQGFELLYARAVLVKKV